MCKHGVYVTIVNFQMNIVYRRKIKNRKKNSFNHKHCDLVKTNLDLEVKRSGKFVVKINPLTPGVY